MKGHIRKRGSKWAFVVDIGKDPVTGKRKQKWFSGYRTKREAEKAMAEKIAEISRGDYVEPKRIPLRDFLNDWLEINAKHRVGVTTYDSYAFLARRYIIPQIGHIPLDKLSPFQLQKLYTDLLDMDKERGEGKISPSTVRRVHNVLLSAFDWAIKMQMIPKNPAKNVQPPKQREEGMIVWTREEAGTFLKTCKGHRLYPLFYLALSTGMRKGELLGLKWEDIEWDYEVIRVRRTLGRTSEGFIVREQPKTAAGRRSVYISSGTVKVLQKHRKRQREELLKIGMTNPEYVFLTSTGKHYDASYIHRTFNALIKKAEVPKIRFHDLRHSHATFLLQEGVHPKIVSERLGHQNIAITLDIYSHVIPSMQKEAAKAFRSFEDTLSE